MVRLPVLARQPLSSIGVGRTKKGTTKKCIVIIAKVKTVSISIELVRRVAGELMLIALTIRQCRGT